MKKCNVMDIEGTEYPAGRRTRVMIGENGAIKGDRFCQGYVVIYPGGSIPLHDHETVESYIILNGTGEISVGDETTPVGPLDFVYIDPGLPHMLKNTGKENMQIMFVYSPAVIVDHWAQELEGIIR